ncbi:MAG TPA: hypothetical protein VLC52_15560 [Anaerolineae bacterium]|nr:hypothetical protein [Anaerolineae bacterium]
MNRIRLLFISLIFWLFFFFSIERPLRMVDICRVAYILVALMPIVTILLPRWRKVPLWVLLVVPVPTLLGLKVLEGDPVWGPALALTITEVCAVGISTILGTWVSNAIAEFEGAVAHITIGRFGTQGAPGSTGEIEMYREVRRARHHQRPLSLLAVGIDEASVQVVLDRMVQEAQQAMIKRYVLSDVARTLCTELEDYNLVAQGNGHFLVLLPEVTSDKLQPVVDRLRRAVAEQIGVSLRVGMACYPENAVTFESLVETAEKEMSLESRTSQSRQPLVMHNQPLPQ